MDTKKYNLKKGSMVLLIGYLVCAMFFLYIAKDQICYTQEEEVSLATIGDTNAGALSSGGEIRQTITNGHQYLTGIKAYFFTYEKENSGELLLSVLNPETGEILGEASIQLEQIQDNAWKTLKFDKMLDLHDYIGEKLEIRFCFFMEDEDAVMSMAVGNTLSKDGILSVNGSDISGELCMSLLQTNDSEHILFYPISLAVFFLMLIAFCAWLIWSDRHDRLNIGLKLIYTFKKYKFLLFQLVSRDFKTKYKRSVLGVFWSFLNPLLTMSVQYLVFSRIFRFQVDNYPAFLITGVVFFNAFSETTTQAMNAIVGNAALITKVYVPKYIYPISRVLSSSINLLFSLIPLLLVTLLTGVKPTLALFMMPFGIICFILFLIGFSFLLSAAMTYFRDMQFLWGVFTMMWMYATPIIYPLETLEGTFLLGFQKINPLYHYITFFRTIIISGVSPEPVEYMICIGMAFMALLIGGLVFKKTQDQFVLHI